MSHVIKESMYPQFFLYHTFYKFAFPDFFRKKKVFILSFTNLFFKMFFINIIIDIIMKIISIINLNYMYLIL
jgi:hypothetical protein